MPKLPSQVGSSRLQFGHLRYLIEHWKTKLLLRKESDHVHEANCLGLFTHSDCGRHLNWLRK